MVNIVSQKRSPKRTSSFLKAELRGQFITQSVCVRDISVNGALLDVSQPLRVFEIVTLICGDTTVNGIVTWYDQGRVGMEFSELLTGKTLTDTLDGQLQVSAPRKYEPTRVPTESE